jgi:hypothetical protein
MRKRGIRGADRPARLLCQGAVEWPSATILWAAGGSIKSDGWILRNEDGVAALRADNLPAGLKLFRNQIAMLKKAGCKRIFEETATGGRWERPELQACLNHLREGDVLVVWKLDRLSRSLSDLLRILEKVDKAGASFKSLTESLDTTGACGRLMMNMLGRSTSLSGR